VWREEWSCCEKMGGEEMGRKSHCEVREVSIDASGLFVGVSALSTDHVEGCC